MRLPLSILSTETPNKSRSKAPKQRPSSDFRGGFLEALEHRELLAAPGSLDLSFGVPTAVGSIGDDFGAAMALQADGKIVVAGDTYNGSNFDFTLVRYNSDGTLDASFDGDGKVTTDFGGDDEAHCVAMQSDGKIVVAGVSYNGLNRDFTLVRYNTNGTLDATFDGDGKLTTDFGGDDEARSIAIQSDGKILVAGDSHNGLNYDFTLVRYNSNGSLDASFDGDGKATTDFGDDDAARSMVIQTDGKIVVVGSAKILNNAVFTVVRYNSDGSLDSSFDGDGKATTDFGAEDNDSANSVALQSDGKIVVAGYTNSVDGGSPNYFGFAVARYNSNGSLDASFDGDGKVTTVYAGNDAARSMVIQSDGKIVVASASYNYDLDNNDFTLLRYNTNGTLDSSFDGDGVLTTDFGGDDEARSMALQSDGKILVAGVSYGGPGQDFTLVRCNSDGSLDASFNGAASLGLNVSLGGVVTTSFGETGSGISGFGNSVALQSDGKIVVAGFKLDLLSFSIDFAVARYNSDGSPDVSFDGDGQLTTNFGGQDSAYSVAIQSDGKIVVAGSSGSDFALARYNADGSLDVSFDDDGKLKTNFGGNDVAYSVAIQPDGKIVVAGKAGATNLETFALARYNSNGSLDTSFDGDGKVTTSFGTNCTGRSVALQSDGKIVVAGYVKFGSNTDFALARYNTNGSLDSSFDGDGVATTAVGASMDEGYSVALQPDGKIVVAGSATFASHNEFALVRYNSNGSLDASFDGDGKATTSIGTSSIDSGVYYSSEASSIALQSDGKIVAAGSAFIDEFGLNEYWALARFNTDGSLDATFDGDGKLTTNLGSGISISPSSVALQPDGKIVVAGTDGANGDFAVARFNAGNGSPIAIANGPYAIAEGSSLTLSAAGSSNPVGDAVTYSWDVNSDGIFTDAIGAAPTLTSAQLQALGVNDGPNAGSVRVRVYLSGGVAVSSPASLTINNVAPTATFGNGGAVGEGSGGTVSFSNQNDVSAVDRAAGFTYSYDFDNNGVFEIVGSAASSVSVPASFLLDGPAGRVVRGRIIDKDGGYTDYTTTITINNVAPTATFGNGGAVGEGSSGTVSFSNQNDASSVDQSAGFTYSYDFDDNGNFEIVGNAASSVSVPASFLQDGPGSRTVRGRITDKDGGYNDYTTTINVDNVAPTISLSGASTVDVGAVYSLTLGVITDPGSDTVTQRTVHWGDGSTSVYASSGVVTHTYTETGPRTIVVDLTDEDSTFANAGSLNLTVQVVSTTTANAGGPYTVGEGNVLGLSGLASAPAPGRTIVSYEWDLDGDGVFGESAAGPFVDGGRHGDETGATTVFDTNDLSVFPPFYPAVALGASLDGPGAYVISLRVTDSFGGTSIASATVNIVNTPPWSVSLGNSLYAPDPVAGISTPLVVVVNDSSFDDSASSFQVDFDWDGNGTVDETQTIHNPSSYFDSNVSHVFATAGTYSGLIRATDRQGAQSSWFGFSITVSPPTTANAGGPYTVGEGHSVNLSGLASTAAPGGTIVSYEWDLDGDGVFGESAAGPFVDGGRHGDETGATTVFDTNDLSVFPPFYPAVALGASLDGPGAYVISLRVTDSFGGTSIASATVNIVNTPPWSVSLGNSLYAPDPVAGISTPLVVVVNDSSFDDSASSFQVDFDWDGNGTVDETQTIHNPISYFDSNVSHVFATAGTYSGFIRATDRQGAQSSWFGFSITVSPPTTADADGPYTIVEGESLHLTAASSAPASGRFITTYEWDLNGDNDFSDASGVNPILSWSQLTALGIQDGPGSANPRVRVTDNFGSMATSAATSLTILNVAPTSGVSGPATAVQGQSKQFKLTANDPSAADQSAGFTFNIDWDGNGTVDQTVVGASGTTVAHAFAAVGAYTIKATATDKDGGVSSMASTSITISLEKGAFGVGGAEIRANTYTTGSQNSPVVASDIFGNYVVVWTSTGQDGSSDGIYGQRFSSSGVAVGTEFRVNVVTTSTQSRPAVAMDLDGDFVVAWQSFGQDGSDFGIYARRYNRFGQAQGSEFLVNTFTTGAQVRASVAMNTAGDFVIGWQSNGQDGSGQGVYGRRYSAAGVAMGGEFQINTTTNSDQRSVRLASDQAGDFVAVWIDASAHDGSSDGIYGRLYNSAGVATTGEFKVNTYTTGSQFDPAAAMDAVGNFVVAWTSNGQDGGGSGIYAQRFNAVGVAQGIEFRVNETTLDSQTAASASMNADGNIIISWECNLQDGSGIGVYARRFQVSVGALSSEFRVNTTTAGDQKASSASQTPNGDLVVSWQSALQDGSAEGVYSRRYSYSAANNILPIANPGGPYVVYEGQSVTLNGSGSTDANGDVLWYRWDVNGDGTLGDAVRVSPTLTWADLLAVSPNPITDGSAGGIVKNVSVRVGDGSGTTLSSTTTITIYNASPTASISGSTSGFTNEALLFTLSATDPSPVDQSAGFTFAIDWDGNGTVDQTVVGASGTTLYHSFATPGLNSIKMTATDKDGGVSAIATTTVNLTASAVASTGSETRVNTQTSDSQNSPTIVMNASGASVAVWVSMNQDGNAEGIYAQRYDSAGAAVGTEFRVNTYTASSQIRPSAAIDSAGNFIITWQSYGQDGNAFGVYAKRYNSSGVALGGEFLVSTTTFSSQIRPTVALNDSGSFVIIWQSFGQDGDGHGLFGQVFNSSGNRVGVTEFAVNTTITKDQQYAKVAMDSAGTFVVVWTSAGGQDGNGDGIFGRRFSATGTALTAEFQVNTTTIGNQFNPTIGMTSAGSFVVAWASSAGQDGNANGVFARRFAANTTALGGEFQVNTYTMGNQQYPTIAMEPVGNFVISWESEEQDGSSYAAMARAFDTVGNPISGEFRLNNVTANNQSFAGVALNSSGQLIGIWQSTGQDSSLEGVYSRRYQLTLPGSDRAVSSPASASDNGSPLEAAGALTGGADAADWFFYNYGQDAVIDFGLGTDVKTNIA